METEKEENSNIKVALNTLLSKGTVILTKRISMSLLNDYLAPLNFLAVKWPGTNEVVLVDYDKKINKNSRATCIFPWKESTTKEAKLVFEQIAHKKAIKENLTGFLCDQNYLYKTENGYFKFTKRTLLNFDEFLMEVNPLRYRKCKICDLIVEDFLIHKACNNK